MRIILILLIMFSIPCSGQNREELWREYQNGNFSFVLNSALKEKNTQDINLNLLIGRTYCDMMNYEAAIPYLIIPAFEKGAEEWEKSWAKAYLGVCYFMTGNSNESRKLLLSSVTESSTKNSANFASKRISLFGFTGQYDEFTIKSSPHFVFHFSPGTVNLISTEKFIRDREDALKEISGFFGATLPGKIQYFVWGNNDELTAATKQKSGFAAPEYRIIHSVYSQSKGHEIAHLFSTTPNKSPLINEGMAVYLDQENRNRMMEARNALKRYNRSLSVLSLWNIQKFDERVFYPVAGAFVEFLIKKGGKDKFLQLLKNQSLQNASDIYHSKLQEIANSFDLELNANM